MTDLVLEAGLEADVLDEIVGREDHDPASAVRAAVDRAAAALRTLARSAEEHDVDVGTREPIDAVVLEELEQRGLGSLAGRIEVARSVPLSAEHER